LAFFWAPTATIGLAGGTSEYDFAQKIFYVHVPIAFAAYLAFFVGAWNGYMLPLFILNDSAQYTLPLGVQAFSSEHSVNTAGVLAFTSLSMIPALLFFSIFERRIVGGLSGAVKG